MIVRSERRFAAYPELVDPHPERGYRVVARSEMGNIENALGGCSRSRRLMFADMDESGSMIARHEIGHAAWSPMEAPPTRTKLMEGCVRAVEDARINSGLQAIGMPFELTYDDARSKLHGFLRGVQDDKLIQAVLIAVACQATPTGQEMLEDCIALRRDYRFAPLTETLILGTQKRLHRAQRKVGETAFPFATALRIARWLNKMLKRHEQSRQKQQEQVQGYAKAMRVTVNEQNWRVHPKPRQNYGSYGTGGFGEPLGLTKIGKRYDPSKSVYNAFDWGRVEPTPMEIHEPHRGISVMPPNRVRVRKHRMADDGVKLKYFHRYAVDQRCFRRKTKRRKGGGSVLLDTSGSMGLRQSDVEAIIKGAPEATTVAIYSGDGTMGQLRILVKDGKRVEDKYFETFAGGNCCDIYALEWLSMQPAPRVWFSDGEVTGEDDRSSGRIAEECFKVCKRHRISRVTGIEACVQVLSGDESRLNDGDMEEIVETDYRTEHDDDCDCEDCYRSDSYDEDEDE